MYFRSSFSSYLTNSDERNLRQPQTDVRVLDKQLTFQRITHRPSKSGKGILRRARDWGRWGMRGLGTGLEKCHSEASGQAINFHLLIHCY